MITSLSAPRFHRPRQLAMAYDAARQCSVLFGGDDIWARHQLSETWEWNGIRWALRSPSMSPHSSLRHAMAYDVVRQRVVLHGGVSDDTTWEWNGRAWSQRLPITSPGDRASHAMAYDLARQRTVLVGGWGFTGGELSHTWEWDGSDWSRRSPTTSPGARAEHAMAYDVARQRAVLFGGFAWASGIFADTWEWDGLNWSRRSPTTSPDARAEHAMAYDVARHRVVLFGGNSLSGYLSDTWEWDGLNWSRRSPASSPIARRWHAMAYDVVRQRTVLFGGESASGYLSDTWEWDGADWSRRVPPSTPFARSLHAMAYDVARQRTVLFGGSYLSDTWLYGTLSPAGAQAFGLACAGRTTPILTSREPILGNAGFTLELIGGRAASACMFGLSAATRNLAIGPCTLYLANPIVSLFAVTNWAGFAESPRFAIPLDLALRGMPVYAQAFVADPQGAVLGLAFSEGRRLVLGD